MAEILRTFRGLKDKIFYGLIGSSAATAGIALSYGCQVRSCSACYGCIAGGSMIVCLVLAKRLKHKFLAGGKEGNNGMA